MKVAISKNFELKKNKIFDEEYFLKKNILFFWKACFSIVFFEKKTILSFIKSSSIKLEGKKYVGVSHLVHLAFH